jgi:hypothetical protein
LPVPDNPTGFSQRHVRQLLIGAGLAARAVRDEPPEPEGHRWDAVVSTPRHLLVPRWFEQNQETRRWQPRDGPSDQDAWLDAAYAAGKTSKDSADVTI